MDRAIRITLNEVKYDVEFETWKKDKVLGQATKGEPIDTAYKDDKAEDWLIRQIQDAINNIYSECRWCTHDDTELATDEILCNPTEWTIHFRFSAQWFGSIRAMASAIHDYVRDYVLARWCLLTMPDMATVYASSAEVHLRKVYIEARSERVQLEPFRL